MKKKNYVYLTYYEHSTGGEVCHGQDDQRFPDLEDEFVDWGLLSCYATPPKDWVKETVEIDFKPEIGQKVWVVYVRYSTGCTFGHVMGAWHIVGVYNNREYAENIKKSVYDETYKGYICWKGYFERFEYCEVEEMTIKD